MKTIWILLSFVLETVRSVLPTHAQGDDPKDIIAPQLR
jgi:hypothetical protein